MEDAIRADDLFKVIEQFAPRLQGAIAQAWRDGTLHVQLKRLTELLAAGLIDEALDLIVMGADAVFAEQVRDTMREPFLAAGAHVWVRDIPKIRGVQVLFDVANENTLNAARANTLRMVQEVTRESRDGLKGYIEDALARGVGAKTLARSIRDDGTFGLTSSQERTVQNYRRFLSTVHEKRSVKAMGLGLKRSLEVDLQGKPTDGIFEWRLRDLRFDRTIARALRENQPLTKEQIDGQLMAYRRGMLRFRSETIARHEMVTALNKGSKASWNQMLERGVYKEGEIARYWFVTPAGTSRVCPKCRPMPRLNAGGRGINEPFIDGQGNPVDDAPLHVTCRCVVFIKIRRS